MPFDLVVDRYLDRGFYINESKGLTQEESLDSNRLTSLHKLEKNDVKFEDSRVINCPVKISHEIINDEKSGKEIVKLNDPAISYVQQQAALFPRFCKIISNGSRISKEEIEQTYSKETLAFFLRHFNCSLKDSINGVRFVSSIQRIQTNKIYIYEPDNIIDKDTAVPLISLTDPPPYLDPTKQEFLKNERILALQEYFSSLKNYPGSVTAKTSQILEDLGYNLSNEVKEHFRYFGMEPGSNNMHPMKKTSGK